MSSMRSESCLNPHISGDENASHKYTAIRPQYLNPRICGDEKLEENPSAFLEYVSTRALAGMKSSSSFASSLMAVSQPARFAGMERGHNLTSDASHGVSTRISAGLNVGFPPPPALSGINPHVGGDEKSRSSSLSAMFLSQPAAYLRG